MPAENTEMQASHWLAREDRGLTEEERRAFDQWQEDSILNRVAYLRLKASWQRADRLAALKRPAPQAMRPQARTSSRPRAFWAVAAAFAVMLGGGAYLAWRLQFDQAYATDIGRIRAVHLADGTQMELNTNTRLHAYVTDAARTVTLESGEAFFDVVHDEKRPFVVYAGNRRITDIGTRFSVFRNGDDVRVTVQEGRVRVETLNSASPTAPVLVQAGRIVVAKDNETLVLAKCGKEIADSLSWRSGRLVFAQQTLAEAAEQFNRYNVRQIVVEGNARKIRIGGSFKADNVDVFVQLLHRGFGLSVNEEGDRIVVSR
jgi:transmembrane sensor